ncbi:uncharacterized protein LOC119736271 isoform X2 [Patiria miniata]|uniref:Protein quiver n=1 Tax=Patiria miniata TaxID=46514 RepID=A0A914AS13_PATMI|nr:uncharacterized protein LOC119736271 isoform X1 [Patiria miniata]XP_038066244.1 uncharacterized protein LOC119736271 isoform X2 [Patiria miniata]
MDGKLLTFLLVVCAASNAVALKCHVCAEGGICTDGDIGELQTCPSVSGFVANQCAKFDGGISGSIAGAEISFSGVIRGCNLLPENFDAPPLQCFSGSEATAYFRNIVEGLVPDGTSIGDGLLGITITGDLCYCADDGCNGVGSLKPFLWLILAVGLMHLLLK